MKMGMCLPCFGGSVDDYDDTPDPELKRQQMAEAAERRKQDQEGKGVRDPEKLKQKQKRREELERKAAINETSEGGLRWQVDR